MTAHTPHDGLASDLLAIIRDFHDFPKPGIVFKDIAPLLRNPDAFRRVLGRMAEHAKKNGATQIVGIESRGFLFGLPLALELGLPFVPARKKGKLPGPVHSESYALEYGVDHVEIQTDALPKGSRSLIVDDVIATGGTAAAVGGMIARHGAPQGASVAGYSFLIELGFLPGREALLKATPGAEVSSIIVL
ncbi:MAG: adenine phosphoribosyltransferase [Silvanigrellales bacterium]|jgi:adenine phosphoribosyltransferase|nr:adenine phosphoribosyltransferase [Silvanigrellales bacterium]